MKEKPLSADEVFVNLIRVGREDKKIGQFLRSVVDLSEFDRKSVINSFLHEMALRGAPADFIKAIAALRDSAMASKVRELLQNESL